MSKFHSSQVDNFDTPKRNLLHPIPLKTLFPTEFNDSKYYNESFLQEGGMQSEHFLKECTYLVDLKGTKQTNKSHLSLYTPLI